MPTEDILPIWVANDKGLFGKHGVEAEIDIFDSAQNLSAALTAGEVDIAMTDPMRAIKLCESGTEVSMEWITLGTEASQGRFGVLAPKDAPYRTLKELATYAETGNISSGDGVGVAANTVPEYVFDKLCEQAGIARDAIPTIEVASLPDRFSLVSSGELVGAALPGSMLTLGEATGLVLLADDSTGDNISQSVMVARKKFNDEAGSKAIAAVRDAWDEAADMINKDPEAYREILVENANLNDTVADSYPISTYPHSNAGNGTSAYPPEELISPIVSWMEEKGYVKGSVTYSEKDGSIAIK